MGILSFLGGLVKPAKDLVDELHTSDEEKGQIKAELTRIENEFAGKLLEYHTKLLDAQSSIITAEANGQSVLQRIWRPLSMLVFLFLILADSFGWLAFRLNDEAWGLFKIGLGGYVIGRSGEKVWKDTPKVISTLKGKL
jgi:hypothetical protein